MICCLGDGKVEKIGFGVIVCVFKSVVFWLEVLIFFCKFVIVVFKF